VGGVVIQCITELPVRLVKPDGCLQRFSSFLVNKEECLFGRLEVCLDGKCEGVVADERAVADEVAPVTQLVKVTEDIEVATSALVPLGNGFVDRDIDTPDSSTVSHSVAVVQTNDVAVDVQVGVVTSCDYEPHTLVLLEQLFQVVVHVELERVALLVGEVRLLGDARVVACVANNGDVEVGVLQVGLNPSVDTLFSEHDGIDWQQVVALHQLFVNRARDEVAQKAKHHLLDVRVTLSDVQQLDGVREELRDARVGHLEVERVETRNLFGPHGFLNVPIRRYHEGRGLRTTIGGRCDDQRLRGVLHPQNRLNLPIQTFIVRHYQAVLLLDELRLGTFITLVAVPGNQLVCRGSSNTALLGLQVEVAEPVFDRTDTNTEVLCQFMLRQLAEVFDEELIFLISPFLHRDYLSLSEDSLLLRASQNHSRIRLYCSLVSFLC